MNEMMYMILYYVKTPDDPAMLDSLSLRSSMDQEEQDYDSPWLSSGLL